MGTETRTATQAWAWWLRMASWFLLIVGPVWITVAADRAPQLAQTVLTGSLGAFFLVLLARIGLAAALQRGRRPALVLLFLGVLLFAAGSSVLNGSGTPDLTKFPAPGEWLFLASYAAIAGFLILDGSMRATTAGATWLETAVICGGSACLAGSVIVTAAAHQFNTDGLPLFLAVLYPLIDCVLGLFVIAQIALRLRGGVKQSAGLLIGFGALAVADSGFLLHLSTGTYDYNIVSIVLWGGGFIFIVGNAVGVRSAEMSTVTTRGLSTLVVSSGMCAAFVLAFEPSGSIRTYLLAPALLTLGASGARLVLALRAARRAAEAIALSHSDDLTELPNRRAVIALLDETLRSTRALGLMILDLDGFKDINDTLGHQSGDAVLRAVAQRMRAALPDSVMIARLGGDEFAIVAPSEDEVELVEIAQQVLLAVRQPLEVDGMTLCADASIGLTARTATDQVSTELLRRADIAMYDAKEHRRGVVTYDPATDEFSRERLSLGEELRRAISNGELVVHYQPQIEAATQRVCGFEALVRWLHPERGLISPAEFLPAARRAGLMQPLSEEVGRLVVADLRRWKKRGFTPRTAINCAPPELMSGIFLPRLAAMMESAGVPSDRIVIEVTEDSFMAEPERARTLLLDLRARGFQMSIDDYGTGFSSLSYLRDLPIHELKMDRSFVSTMTEDARSHMIVSSTIQMAKALGLRTVAEGVENAATAADLIAMGVDVLQGYYLSRPIEANQVMRFAATYAFASEIAS